MQQRERPLSEVADHIRGLEPMKWYGNEIVKSAVRTSASYVQWRRLAANALSCIVGL